VRELAIAIAAHGGGAEVQEPIEKFRQCARNYREGKSRLDDRREQVARLRDAMVERA